jgi:hypothetical protein
MLASWAFLMMKLQFRDSAREAQERAAREATSTPPTTISSEARIDQGAGEEGGNKVNDSNDDKEQQFIDPLIYPGLYSPSGFNIMNILVSLANLSYYLIIS